MPHTCTGTRMTAVLYTVSNWCGQLIGYGAHIDLNARSGDDIVWPWDLKDSSKAVTYATVR